MPKIAATRTIKWIEAKAKHGPDGTYCVSTGLYLQRRGGAASLVCRYMVNGKARTLGLGPWEASDNVLTLARQAADGAIKAAKAGNDPVAQKKVTRAALLAASSGETFPELVEKYLEKRASKKRTPKHWRQWKKSLENHAYPAFGNKPWRTITKLDVKEMLDPIWAEKTVTASRVRNRCERVFEFGYADDEVPPANPAALGYVNIKLNPATEHHAVKHFTPMDFDELPELFAKLAQRTQQGAKALQLVMLTACRSDTARNATWGEFDLAAKTWTVKRSRAKSRKDEERADWQCPLSQPVLDLLAAQGPGEKHEFVFKGRSGPIAHDRMDRILKAEGGVHVHGARSVFVQWANRKGWRDAGQFQLDHILGDDTERAYAQDETLYEQRREIMNQWADYVTGGAAESNVVRLHANAN